MSSITESGTSDIERGVSSAPFKISRDPCIPAGVDTFIEQLGIKGTRKEIRWIRESPHWDKFGRDWVANIWGSFKQSQMALMNPEAMHMKIVTASQEEWREWTESYWQWRCHAEPEKISNFHLYVDHFYFWLKRGTYQDIPKKSGRKDTQYLERIGMDPFTISASEGWSKPDSDGELWMQVASLAFRGWQRKEDADKRDQDIEKYINSRVREHQKLKHKLRSGQINIDYTDDDISNGIGMVNERFRKSGHMRRSNLAADYVRVLGQLKSNWSDFVQASLSEEGVGTVESYAFLSALEQKNLPEVYFILYGEVTEYFNENMSIYLLLDILPPELKILWSNKNEIQSLELVVGNVIPIQDPVTDPDLE